MIPTIAILILAGVVKAVKDRLDNPFTKSVFPTKGAFWVRGTGKKVLGQYLDAWHIADTLYISCWCVLVALHYQIISGVALSALLYFAGTQTAFNIFYFILKRKK